MKKSLVLVLAMIVFSTTGIVTAKRVAGAPDTGEITVTVENKTGKEQTVEVILSRFFGTRYPELTSLGSIKVPPQQLLYPKKTVPQHVQTSASGRAGAYLKPGTSTQRFQIPQKDLNRMTMIERKPVFASGRSTYSVMFKVNGKELEKQAQKPRLMRTPATIKVTITNDGVKVEQAKI